MTGNGTSALTAGRIALLLAALVLAFVVGYALSRPSGDAAEAEVAEAGTPSAMPSIENLERQANENPKDADAWLALGIAYFDQNRFADAANAYGKAAGIDPQRAEIWSALGEARVMGSERDPMPEAAVDAFNRAIALDAGEPRARYFLAVKKDLSGDHDGAIADWLELLEDTPADAPWRGDLVRTIEQVGRINEIDVADRIAAAESRSPGPAAPAARAIPGPTAQDLAAASAIPPGEQREMAEGMVARLEQRLATDPANVEGWIMLMRSRMTLGQPAKAARALRDGLAANPGQADLLRQQAGMLGIAE